jgi:hypothetical protein
LGIKERKYITKQKVGAIYTFHGHTDDGTYVIFIQEYDYGSYSGKSRIFINGEEIFSLPCYGVDRIRDYGNGWLILVSFTGSARNPDGHYYWSLYNYATGELREFGVYDG